MPPSSSGTVLAIDGDDLHRRTLGAGRSRACARGFPLRDLERPTSNPAPCPSRACFARAPGNQYSLALETPRSKRVPAGASRQRQPRARRVHRPRRRAAPMPLNEQRLGKSNRRLTILVNRFRQAGGSASARLLMILRAAAHARAGCRRRFGARQLPTRAGGSWRWPAGHTRALAPEAADDGVRCATCCSAARSAPSTTSTMRTTASEHGGVPIKAVPRRWMCGSRWRVIVEEEAG